MDGSKHRGVPPLATSPLPQHEIGVKIMQMHRDSYFRLLRSLESLQHPSTALLWMSKPECVKKILLSCKPRLIRIDEAKQTVGKNFDLAFDRRVF